jgi:UPF0755 protein
MSGPGDRGPGGRGGPGGPGYGDDDELPWPTAGPDAADRDDGDDRDARYEGREAAGGDDDSGSAGRRSERRAARAAVRRRRRRILAGIAGGLAVLVCAVVLWYELESHALGPEGRQVVVTVKEGESTSSIIDALSAQHVIGSSVAFRVFDVLHGSPTVLPGSYALHQNQTFGEVRTILAAGPNIYPVDVRPGFTFSEVASQVDSIPGHDEGGFQRAATAGTVHSAYSPAGSNDLEGMLGTGEYLVLPGESDDTVLADMVRRFDQDTQADGLTTASAAALGVTPYQLLTAASIVEKEGYIPVNMPKVARVIYNRLAQGQPLQMDATVLYALGQDGGPVTSKDLQLQSPYNTYLNTGLTPTPICMPSKDAMDAALHPPAGSWLYFVLVQKNGVMAFSDTYAQQLANEQLAKSRGLP